MERDNRRIALNCCTQCGGCKSICPQSAITIIQDKEGFWKPKINESACVNCGLCEKTCPHISRENGNSFHSVSLFLTDDRQTYYQSSSGGAIAELYTYFLRKDAKCVGVRYVGDDLLPQYTVANTMDEVVLFRGSKYVEASSIGIFETVHHELVNRATVFFVGTPCAVSGLLNYLNILKTDTKGLYTCEFVCNGVGSSEVFKRYINYLKKGYKKEIIDFRFRVKQTQDGVFAKNSTTHHSRIVFTNESIEDTDRAHVYQNLYFKQLISNPACHICKYTNSNRVADLTVGDSIGYQPQSDDIQELRYSSMVLSNTDKGDFLLDVLKKQGQMRSIDIGEVKQPHLLKASAQHSKRSLFWRIYKMFGFKTVAAIFGGINPISKMRKGWK